MPGKHWNRTSPLGSSAIIISTLHSSCPHIKYIYLFWWVSSAYKEEAVESGWVTESSRQKVFSAAPHTLESATWNLSMSMWGSRTMCSCTESGWAFISSTVTFPIISGMVISHLKHWAFIMCQDWEQVSVSDYLLLCSPTHYSAKQALV